MFARLRGIALLSLFAATACDGGGTTAEADATVSGLAKVSGDAQSTQVILPSSPGGAAFALEISALASHDAALLPDLLVARIELAKPSGAPAPSTAPVPTGTSVQWDVGVAGVPGADPRCGSTRTAATRADDSAHVVNGWRKGTLANVTCVARASLYAGSTLVAADSFTAQFTPGPPEVGKRLDGHHPDAPHQLLLDPRAVQDAYGNGIPFRIVTPAQDTFVWAGGTAWGTAESRTLHWKDIGGTATQVQEGYFYLVNEAGARIAWVSYRLFPTQPGMEYTSLSGVKGDF